MYPCVHVSLHARIDAYVKLQESMSDGTVLNALTPDAEHQEWLEV